MASRGCGPISATALLRIISKSAFLAVNALRSRVMRRLLRRSIFQRLYSASFSSTRKDVYSVIIE